MSYLEAIAKSNISQADRKYKDKKGKVFSMLANLYQDIESFLEINHSNNAVKIVTQKEASKYKDWQPSIISF